MFEISDEWFESLVTRAKETLKSKTHRDVILQFVDDL